MLLKGLDGCAILSPRVCETFGPILRLAINDLVRREGLRFPNEVYEELEAIEAAARASRQRRTLSADVAIARSQSLLSEKVTSVNELSVTEAARRGGTSRQAVLARIGRGSLPARRDERGRWLIRAENLEVAS